MVASLLSVSPYPTTYPQNSHVNKRLLGVYTRDLIYNAQKPAFIDAPPVDGERLVNFDRHHTAATIVKNLLRLLEASSKYSFKIEPDVISKCLWLAALSDEEIAERGRLCE
jgi:hypothetical protein